MRWIFLLPILLACGADDEPSADAAPPCWTQYQYSDRVCDTWTDDNGVVHSECQPGYRCILCVGEVWQDATGQDVCYIASEETAGYCQPTEGDCIDSIEWPP